MKIVLDTNVLVAGLLSPYGPPAGVLQMLVSGKLRLCYDGRILTEYRDVLARPKFGLDPDVVADLIEYLEQSGELAAATPWGLALPDANDLIFLEVALGGQARHLVTGNIKHFPARERRGVSVLKPAQFLGLPEVAVL